MARSREMTLSLPPFTRVVIWLLAANTGVFCCWNSSAWGCPTSCVGSSITASASTGGFSRLGLATGYI